MTTLNKKKLSSEEDYDDNDNDNYDDNIEYVDEEQEQEEEEEEEEINYKQNPSKKQNFSKTAYSKKSSNKFSVQEDKKSSK